jgi:cyclic pyranopterin monophosphate synthase
MIDITEKPPVRRTATASGMIRLKESTIEAVRNGLVPKGDVLSIARIAAILAVKETPKAIPMCHQIPITSIKVDFSFEPGAVRTEVEVTSIGKTGVEMEALSGVSSALLNIWDMVKSMEKDETGNYPTTEIGEIVVLKKVKGQD